jgi:hypothetical protein
VRKPLGILLVTLVGFYACDYFILELRVAHPRFGDAYGQVQVFYATPLKNGKTEIFYDQPQFETCVHSVFPHFGYRPCWIARSQVIKSAGEFAPDRGDGLRLENVSGL